MPVVKKPLPSKQPRLDPAEGIALFTDGSADYRDGSGGWAWLALDAYDGEDQGIGGTTDTTNNRMEMTAWTEGLNTMFDTFGPCTIIVYSDSEYVGYGAMDRSRKRNANVDLWLAMDEAIDRHLYVEFRHVKGHDGNEYNEIVDRLAHDARQAFKHSAT